MENVYRDHRSTTTLAFSKTSFNLEWILPSFKTHFPNFYLKKL